MKRQPCTVTHLAFVLFASTVLGVLGCALSRLRKTGHMYRLGKPIVSLSQNTYLKGILALLAVEIHVPQWFIDILSRAFDVRADAAFALSFVMVFDLLSGIYASWWKKSSELDRFAYPSEFFYSYKLRESIVKIGEYIAILMLLTVASNVWSVEVGWAQRWTYMMIFFTEAWSTRENFQHAPVTAIFDRLRSVYEKKNPGKSSLNLENDDSNE